MGRFVKSGWNCNLKKDNKDIDIAAHKDIVAFKILQTWIGYAAMFEKLPYPLVSAISVILKTLPCITKL